MTARICAVDLKGTVIFLTQTILQLIATSVVKGTLVDLVKERILVNET